MQYFETFSFPTSNSSSDMSVRIPTVLLAPADTRGIDAVAMEMGSVCPCVCASVRPARCCERDISRTVRRISTRLHQWTCMDSASDEFDRVQILRMLMSCAGIWWSILWTWSLENGLMDFDQTSPVDLYGQCFGSVRLHANFAHTNELCCHLIGWYCSCSQRDRGIFTHT
jgi:hypothetical protein